MSGHSDEALREAFLLLAKEVWVMRDRQFMLEELLHELTGADPEAIDRRQPDERETAKLAEECDRFLGALIERLNPSD